MAFYRDDIGLRPVLPEAVTDISFDLGSRVVVLVDDVLFTGRTIRAALDAITDFGRPRAVQLAVMIDRGHRELPIRPDYVGMSVAIFFGANAIDDFLGAGNPALFRVVAALVLVKGWAGPGLDAQAGPRLQAPGPGRLHPLAGAASSSPSGCCRPGVGPDRHGDRRALRRDRRRRRHLVAGAASSRSSGSSRRSPARC